MMKIFPLFLVILLGVALVSSAVMDDRETTQNDQKADGKAEEVIADNKQGYGWGGGYGGRGGWGGGYGGRGGWGGGRGGWGGGWGGGRGGWGGWGGGGYGGRGGWGGWGGGGRGGWGGWGGPYQVDDQNFWDNGGAGQP